MNWFTYTLGGALIGVAAYLLLQDGNWETVTRGRAPVADLADQLQHAWADQHNTAV